MAETTSISWASATQNFWLSCDRVAPECEKCYIDRSIRRMGREPWGQIYRTKTWNAPGNWQRKLAQNDAIRVFTCSLSDFFHAKADEWRAEAWQIIKDCPNLIWLILTKRPERILRSLPPDWGEGYQNVWLGVSTGCRMTLNKMDLLRKVPVHPQAVRWVSAEPLLEDISKDINLDGFGWIVVGGESGSGDEYLWDPAGDWRKEFERGGRRTMMLEWAQSLLAKARDADIPYFFKQVTAPLSGQGERALGMILHEFPEPPAGLQWHR